MIKYFKILETNEVVDVLEYITKKVAENKFLKIYVGTDSQNYGAFTHYGIAIVLRNETRGGHVLYRKEKLPRIRDHFTRLWKEAEYSLEVAQWLRDNSAINVDIIELDYAGVKVTKSTNLVAATSGWITSQGFKVKVKPNDMIACKAADHICRNF